MSREAVTGASEAVELYVGFVIKVIGQHSLKRENGVRKADSGLIFIVANTANIMHEAHVADAVVYHKLRVVPKVFVEGFQGLLCCLR